MHMRNAPTAELCHWVCSTEYEDLPPEVRREAVTMLYDQVGAMIACATLPSCQPVVNFVRQLGSGDCSVVGHPLRVPVTNAALANGTIGHADEVDSTGQEGGGHFASINVAAALTVGQYVGASGTAVCRALALGSEISARCQGILFQYGKRPQFFNVGGVLGVAVNAGLLLQLTADQMEHALSLAASATCGLSSCHLEHTHQNKSLNRGKAAEAGVQAALLAREGVHGAREILTVENGFFDAFLGMRSAGKEMVHALGDEYAMRRIAYKRYPVCGPIQAPLHAFLELIKEHALGAEDIEQTEASVSRNGYGFVVTNPHPAHNLAAALSLAAVYGQVTFAHINEAGYGAAERVRRFLATTRIMVTPRLDIAGHGERLNTAMTVRTRDGQVIRKELRYPSLSEDEIKQKFRSLAGLRLDDTAVASLESKLLEIEREGNVAPLVRELELPYANAR